MQCENGHCRSCGMLFSETEEDINPIVMGKGLSPSSFNMIPGHGIYSVYNISVLAMQVANIMPKIGWFSLKNNIK